MNIIQSIKGVLHLEFRNRTELTLSMCRIQEFFESTHEHIRGKVFTLEAFLATYYAPGHDIDYLAYWEGFNVPAASLNDFFNRYGDNITLRESVIKHAWKSGEFKYLIAVEENGAQDVIDHELAHARYALDEGYRMVCNKIIASMHNDHHAMYCKALKNLLDAGYPDDGDIMYDELHAYLRTSTESELTETFPDIPLSELQPYIDRLRAIQ